MMSYYVARTGEQDLVFEGNLLAKKSFMSGATDVSFYLYETKQNYVCARVFNYGHDVDKEKFLEGKVCSTPGAVFDYFGFSEMAKELYIVAEFDHAQWVR